MDENQTEQDIKDLQSKASAFVEITNLNKHVIQLGEIMEECKLNHKTAKAEYEKGCKKLQEMIKQYSTELPLFNDHNGGP